VREQREGGSPRTRGPRQDVAFLALAVAVLAIAVALFVGLRSLPRGGAKTAAAAAAAEKQVAAAPEKVTPRASGKRDPFRSAAGGESKPAGPGEAKAQPAPSQGEVRLVGIVRGAREPLAVVRRGDRRYYAKVGERAAGYTVVGIGDNYAVLTRGGEQLRLTLYEESGREE
jgi:hypothetical protein